MILNRIKSFFNRPRTCRPVDETDHFSVSKIIAEADCLSPDIIRKRYNNDKWLTNRALNIWEYAKGRIELESIPTDIILPCCNICNANCIMCNLNPQKPVYLTPDKLKAKFGSLLPYAEQLGLTSFGDPLVNPQIGNLCKRVDQMADQRCNVYVTTNGILLKDRFPEIKNCIKNINVSLNAASSETHCRIMRAGNVFNNILEGIKMAVSWRQTNNPSPRINISAVIMKDNFYEIPDFIRMGNELGVDSIALRVLMPKDNNAFYRECTPDSSYDNFNPELRDDYETIRGEIIREICNSEAEIVNNDLRFGEKYYTKTISCYLPDKCFRPYTTALFFGDCGEIVQPCCFMSGEMPNHYTYPDYKDAVDFIDDIWNGEFYTELRESFKNNKTWPNCQDCLTRF